MNRFNSDARIRKIRKTLDFLCKYGPMKTVRKIRRHRELKSLEQRCAVVTLAPVTEQERKSAEELSPRIRFSILVPLYNTPEAFLREMIRSVEDQAWTNWELCLADGSDERHPEVGRICREMAEQDSRIRYRKLGENNGISENTNACIDLATGDYIALLDHDDLLHPAALFECAKAILEQGADFVYTDEAVFLSPDRGNWFATHFKPDYAPENLLSNNYICHLSVFRALLLQEAGRFRKEYDGSQDFDLILRLTGCVRKIAHIPKILYFWRSHSASTASGIETKTYAIQAGQRAVEDFLREQRGICVKAESVPEYPTLYRTRFPLWGTPEVHLILDATGYGESGILRRIRGILKGTDWKKLQVTVITDREIPDCAESGIPVTFLKIREENRSARLNEAARRGGGEFLLFLDMKLQPLRRNWVEELLMLAQQDEIGCVGGKLFFRDNTLRHGGLAVGLGANHLAGRIQFREERGSGGYIGCLAVVEDVSAVSGECLMIRRERFEKADGFDGDFRDTLYDVDLCLRLLDRGYRNVYTPFAELRGGASRKYPMDYGTESLHYAEDAETLRKKHTGRLGRPDPYYNPNLIPEE